MITLKTLPQATEQEVFDQVKEHLLKQGVRSQKLVDGRYICAYRGENGLKCAAGCLIGDDEYDPRWECSTWKGIQEESSPHSDLITSLQMIHDEENPSNWGDALGHLAQEHGLKY